MEMTERERAEALDEIRELREQLFVDAIEAFLWDTAMAARIEQLAVVAA
jgi:hypothetical protein